MKLTAIAQMFTPLPFDCNYPILCCYINATSELQIARIANIANWYFERVVFPGQRLLFTAVPEANLEIYTYVMPTTTLAARLPCDRLRVNN